MMSMEQRKKFEETVGDRVKGFAGGHLRMAAGSVYDDTLLVDEEPVEQPPAATRPPRVIRDHTSTARVEFEGLRRANRPAVRGPYASELAWLEQQRAKARP